MLVRNAWYVAIWADELQDAPIARRICDIPVVLFRSADGTPAALLDRCCHRAAPLSLGKVTADGLECGYHGLIFNGSGACVCIPGQTHIPSATAVRSFPVVEKNALIWIWVGDGAADPNLIVDYPFHGDPVNWPYRKMTVPVNASWILLIDNLMDLTHVGYVHHPTIGGVPAAHADAKTVTEPTPRGLKLTRWILDGPPSPMIQLQVPFSGNIDRWQEFELIAPSVVRHWAGAVGFNIRLFHGITPETATTCTYFLSIATGFAHDDPLTAERALETTRVVIAEDKVMIEEQQRRFTELGDEGLVNTHTDGARVSMRRTIDAMLKKEERAESLLV
jgi:phenylpropionate dioxygenase-like ring-hydroxylating dioxygenase large terminal subunit